MVAWLVGIIIVALIIIVGLKATQGAASHDPDRLLEDAHVPMLLAISGGQVSISRARQIVRSWIKEAKKKALAQGTTDLPQNYGDILLAHESRDEGVRTLLAKARADGARDGDIREWWNLSDIERRLVMKMDEHLRFVSFVGVLEGTEEEDARRAAREIWKSNALYGDPDDTRLASGNDRPLPYELKGRVNRWAGQFVHRADEAITAEIQASSSLNAFLRRKIREGVI